MTTKPIRVRQIYEAFGAPMYSIYVRGDLYTCCNAPQLNTWLGYALTHVRATSGALEPLQRCE